MADYSSELRQRFVDQFTPERDGYIYRKHAIGVAIHVSQSERDRYVALFEKFQKYGKRGVVGGTLLVAVVFVTWATVSRTEPPEFAFYAGFALIVAIYMVFHFWVWSLPVRELRGRGVTAPALSREEVTRQQLGKLSYTQIAVTAIIAVGPLTKIIISRQDPFAGWNLFWLVMGTLAVLFSIFAAIRKWRFGSALR